MHLIVYWQLLECMLLVCWNSVVECQLIHCWHGTDNLQSVNRWAIKIKCYQNFWELGELLPSHVFFNFSTFLRPGEVKLSSISQHRKAKTREMSILWSKNMFWFVTQLLRYILTHWGILHIFHHFFGRKCFLTVKFAGLSPLTRAQWPCLQTVLTCLQMVLTCVLGDQITSVQR